MPIQNPWVYTRTLFEVDKFLKATGNIYQLVSQRPFSSKKNPDEKGVLVTLLITHDEADYGVDKNGNKRDNNVLNTFDVTILCGETSLPIRKGEKVSLGNYLPDKSYVIGFDLILRFDSIRKVSDAK